MCWKLAVETWKEVPICVNHSLRFWVYVLKVWCGIVEVNDPSLRFQAYVLKMGCGNVERPTYMHVPIPQILSICVENGMWKRGKTYMHVPFPQILSICFEKWMWKRGKTYLHAWPFPQILSICVENGGLHCIHPVFHRQISLVKFFCTYKYAKNAKAQLRNSQSTAWAIHKKTVIWQNIILYFTSKFANITKYLWHCCTCSGPFIIICDCCNCSCCNSSMKDDLICNITQMI